MRTLRLGFSEDALPSPCAPAGEAAELMPAAAAPAAARVKNSRLFERLMIALRGQIQVLGPIRMSVPLNRPHCTAGEAPTTNGDYHREARCPGDGQVIVVRSGVLTPRCRSSDGRCPALLLSFPPD